MIDDGELEAKRRANRAAFPAIAEICDEFREVFGEGGLVWSELCGRDYSGGAVKMFRCDFPDAVSCDACPKRGVDYGELVVRDKTYPMEVYIKHQFGIGRGR